MNTSCYNEPKTLDQIRMILQNCGAQLRAKDFEALLDYIEHVAGFSFGLFMGIADPSTNPAADERVSDNAYGWYLADLVGTYTNFLDKDGNPITVSAMERKGSVVILAYDKCDNFWYKWIYNVDSNGDMRKYVFTVAPSSTTIPFAYNNELGGGSIVITLDIVSQYENIPAAYLSEQNLPSWLKFEGLTDNGNGRYTVNLVATENNGALRCVDIQFVQFGSNFVRTVKVCQNASPLWEYQFDILGETLVNETFYREATNKVYKVTSLKSNQFIDFVVNNQLPSWYNMVIYNEYLFLSMQENATEVKRQYSTSLRQLESNKEIQMDITQFHTANPYNYIFTINDQIEEAAVFDIMANSKLFNIVSTKDGADLGYTLLNMLPDWVTINYSSGSMRLSVAGNNTGVARTTKLIFIQDESGKYITIDITQSETCEDTPQPVQCTFSINGSTNPTLTRPSGASSIDVGVLSLMGNTPISYVIDNPQELPEWLILNLTPAGINITVTENTQPQDRDTSIRLRQEGMCTNTLTIYLVQREFVPSQVCPGTFEAGEQVAYQTTRIILGETAGTVRLLLGTYEQADSFDIYYGHDLTPQNLLWSTKSLPTADPQTGLVATANIRRDNYNNGEYKQYSICVDEEISGNNQEYMYEVAVTFDYNPRTPGIDYVTLVTQAPEIGTRWSYKMGCPCFSGQLPPEDWNYCQDCSEGTIYYSTEQCTTATRNNCSAIETPSTERVCAQARQFTSTESVDAANIAARAWLEENKQALANAQGTCTPIPVYYNTKQCGTASRDNCPIGSLTSPVEFCIDAGTYDSYIDVDDANRKAQEAVEAGKQAYANANGICSSVYRSAPYCENFTKSDCPEGQYPIELPYCTVEGQFTSGESQAAANKLAEDHVKANGQAYADLNGTCGTEYANTRQCKSFLRNNCPIGSKPQPYEYCVEAGKYTSIINQADADQKALNEIDAQGQTAANSNGVCQEVNTDPNWVLTGITNCSTSETENEGTEGEFFFQQERDENTNSESYGTLRFTRNAANDGACVDTTPTWEDLEVVCSCSADSVLGDGDGAYAFKRQQDVNPNSENYMQIRSIRASSEDTQCPKSEGTWIVGTGADATMCDGYNKYVQEFLHVCGVKTETTRRGALIEENSVDCGGKCDPVWENTNNTRCVQEDGRNTGATEVEQRDVATCSESYGDIQWIPGPVNTVTCPIPVGNARQCQTFNKACDSGFTGSPVEYCVAPNTHYADTQTAANELARLDIVANGQKYANDNGTCASTAPTWEKTNSTRCNGCTGQSLWRDTNPNSSGYNNTEWRNDSSVNCNSPSWSFESGPNCVPPGNLANCSIRYQDTNPCSPTYRQRREDPALGQCGNGAAQWSGCERYVCMHGADPGCKCVQTDASTCSSTAGQQRYVNADNSYCSSQNAPEWIHVSYACTGTNQCTQTVRDDNPCSNSYGTITTRSTAIGNCNRNENLVVESYFCTGTTCYRRSRDTNRCSPTYNETRDEVTAASNCPNSCQPTAPTRAIYRLQGNTSCQTCNNSWGTSEISLVASGPGGTARITSNGGTALSPGTYQLGNATYTCSGGGGTKTGQPSSKTLTVPMVAQDTNFQITCTINC